MRYQYAAQFRQMARFNVGVHLRPQQTTMQALRNAWKEADRLGVDVITTWDHFFPRQGDPEGPHFECWSMLAAMACDTSRARFGSLATCVHYRNPNLLADMARTVDHISGGRLNLGLGAGNTERDFIDYGYEYGTAGYRLKKLEEALVTIKRRLARLNPPPMGPLPMLIGGGGEKVTLRLVAQHANMWNTPAAPDEYARKNRVLDEWCARISRNPAEIERTVNVPANAVDKADEWLEAGAQLLLVQMDQPFDMKPVERILQIAGK
jgi:probable F420-dependent oxidoreductase